MSGRAVKNVVASVLARLGNHSKSSGAPFQQVLPPSEEFGALTMSFVERHRVQWNTFVIRVGEHDLIDAFGKVIEDLKTFAMPVFRSLAHDEKLMQRWKAGTGWMD
jgi:hypothetical protein